MSEDAEHIETEQLSPTIQLQETSKENAFLKSSETAQLIIDGLKLDGFQLGGGGIDFALGEFGRPHDDIDMVYIIDSITWEDYLKNPKQTPKERQSLQNITQEPEFFRHTQILPRAMEMQGVPGLRMTGPELPILVDFIEAYRHQENGKNYIMLPIYEGQSYIKIPVEEIIDSEIEGVKTKTVSSEVHYLIKEQANSLKRTLEGGPPPDRRPKAKQDMERLKEKVDLNKVKRMRATGMGFNFSLLPATKFRIAKLVSSLVN